MLSEQIAQLYIDGEWCASESDDVIESLNPTSPDKTVTTFPAATVAETREAVSASVQGQSEWATLSSHDRGDFLRDAARIVEAEKEEFAELIATETGKTIGGSRGEVQRAIDLFDFYAQTARDYGGTAPPSSDNDTVLYTSREPWGTAGIITPWNFPLAIPVWKITPALVSGNTVVFKPASVSPGIGARLVDVLDRTGMPDGVINFVTGAGSEVGSEIVSNSDVDVVSFTGSTTVGKQVEVAAARERKRVQCEMGGKNPIIVDSSCDIDLAVELTVSGAYGLAGQACTATSRAIVLDDVHDQYVRSLQQSVEDLIVGDATSEETDMGPKSSTSGLTEDLEYIESGLDDGATVLTGGKELDRDGYFIEPTVFIDVEPEMRIAQEEIFGPVLSIIRVSDFEEAVDVANDVKFGLSAAICTDRLHHAMSAADNLEVGVVKVNQTSTGVEFQMPFGGRKQSSTETYKEQGRQALDFYTHEKAVYLTDGHS